jgi:membrane protein DedA with SNARE-associated domain
MMVSWIQTWFQWVHDWGYVGIFLLMAMESSIFPVPSEVVVPPAAFWAAQGRFSMWGVVVAATAGSLFGSLVTYAVSLALGRPFILKYGKYFLLPPAKVEMAERFITTYAVGGIFFARLLPVVRHLCSIPAGFVRMDLKRFTAATTIGAALWCSILAWFGNQVIGDRPEILQHPEGLPALLKERLHYFIIAALVLFVAYVIVKRLTRAPENAPSTAS